MTRLEVTRTRIRENESLLDTLQKRLQEIAGTWGEHGPDADSALSASIQVKEEELLLVEAQIAPIPLYSPVDGIISAIHLPNGSFTRQGEVLVTVHAPQVEYVMGYIRQPVRTLPEIGTEVQILVPARNQWFSGMITHIGNQMVPVHDMLARTVGQTEYALPLRIQIAPDSPVLPGERIEIRL